MNTTNTQAPRLTKEEREAMAVQAKLEAQAKALARFNALKALAKFTSTLSGKDLQYAIEKLTIQDEVFQNTVIENLHFNAEQKESIKEYIERWATTFTPKLLEKLSI